MPVAMNTSLVQNGKPVYSRNVESNVISPTVCRYCGNQVELRKGKYGCFYYCRGCAAKIGCHPGTNVPLGTLANAELADYRKRAHAAFDPIWKEKRMSRHDAYRCLAKKLGIRMADCHIAMFEIDDCLRAIEAVHEGIDA